MLLLLLLIIYYRRRHRRRRYYVYRRTRVNVHVSYLYIICALRIIPRRGWVRLGAGGRADSRHSTRAR